MQSAIGTERPPCVHGIVGRVSADAVYLDHNASAPLLPAAREALLAALDAGAGNASSAHGAGQRQRRILDDARESVAALLGARASEVVFTSGATEANALALRSAAATDANRRRIVTTHAEHPSVLAVARALEQSGHDLVIAGVDRFGRASAEEVCELVDASTGVISMVLAQPVTGALQPVAELAAEVAGRGAVLHTDATQAVGKVRVDLTELGADLVSLSGHKFGAPHGIGALIVREGTTLRNALWSGAQERGRRAGTEAVALAAAFGAAAGHVRGVEETFARHSRGLVDLLRDHAVERLGATCLSPGEGVLPNTCLLLFEGCPGDMLAAALDADGVHISTGTACASGARTPPEVLLAAGLSPDAAACAIRVSVGAVTRSSDVLGAIRSLGSVIPRVRAALATT